VVAYIAGHCLLFCLFGLVLCLPGMVLVPAVFQKRELGELRNLAGISLGLAVWMATAFVLATARLLWLGSFLSLAAMWVALGMALWLRRSGESRSGWLGRYVSLQDCSMGACLLLVLAPVALLAMSPDVAWDAGTYHLTVPKLYLAYGGFRHVAFNLYSNWPLNTEMLFALAMLWKDYVLAAMLHCVFGSLILYAMFTAMGNSQRRDWAWLAVFLFLMNHIVLWEMTVAYVDLVYSFFFLTGFVFAMRAVDLTADRKPALLLSGICSGVLMGVKLSGVFGAATMMAFLLYSWARRARSEGNIGLQQILQWHALPALSLSLPWYAKTAWYTGNPVYPFFYDWLGGPEWSARLSDQFEQWQRAIGMGRGVVDYLLLPLRVILQGGPGYANFDGRVSLWWVVLIPVMIAFGGQARLVRRCVAAAGLYFVMWSLTSQQVRFLVPVLPFLCIAAASTIGMVLDGVRAPRRRRRIASVLVLIAFSSAAIANWENWVGAASFARNLWSSGEEVVDRAVHPVFRFINDTLPPEATLLCLNTNQGFFLDRPYLADSCFEASQIADWLRSAEDKEEVGRWLGVREITHVLVASNERGIRYPAPLTEFLAAPELARRVYRSPDGMFSLFEVLEGSTESPKRGSAVR